MGSLPMCGLEPTVLGLLASSAYGDFLGQFSGLPLQPAASVLFFSAPPPPLLFSGFVSFFLQKTELPTYSLKCRGLSWWKTWSQ